MATLNLCIDIGNTSTKAALFKDGEEVNYWKPFSADIFKELTSYQSVTILVSKTGKNEELEALLSEKDYLTSRTNLPLKLDYKTPQTLGPDRIATAAGVLAIDKENPWVIIDLGTCLTLDLVAEGAFQGGLISPGVQMRFKAMHEFTAALPLVQMDFNTVFPGKSTQESLQVGVCQSIMHEITGYITMLNKGYPYLNVMDCSSLALNFDKDLKNKIFARPKLVLYGLNYILEQNAN
jgi:type III pantothenate kinase